MKRNFTLTELLIVIAIIGILSSLLLPALGRARDSANATKCVNNMKQITAALIEYSNNPQNKNTMPVEWAEYDTNNDGRADNDGARTWMEQLVHGGYLPEGGEIITTSKGEKMKLSEVFFCPKDPNFEGSNSSSYALNLYVSQPANYYKTNNYRNSTTANVNVSTVKSPSNLAILFENTKETDNPNLLSVNLSDLRNTEFEGSSLLHAARHSESTNIGYMDGRVAAMSMDELNQIVKKGQSASDADNPNYKLLKNLFGMTGQEQPAIYDDSLRLEICLLINMILQQKMVVLLDNLFFVL